MNPAQPVRLILRSSWSLSAAIVAVHACAGILLGTALGGLELPGWVGALVGALFFLLGIEAARTRGALWGGRALRAIEILGTRDIALEYANGLRVLAGAHTGRYAGRLGIALVFRSGWIWGAHFIAADMLEREDLRLLSIWALWRQVPSRRRAVPKNRGSGDN